MMMPQALLKYLGYYIYFWIGDGEEPVHVHVSRKPQHDATKYWITSDSVELAKNTSTVDKKDMKNIIRYLRKNRERILASWVKAFHNAEVKR